ncbi:MAG: DUF4382 domain-containing protein, partial [Halobacteriales archaeon]
GGDSDGSGGGGGGSGGDGDADAGSFSLLISDQPAAIGDFDSLNVSFEKARVFRGEGEGESEGSEESGANETAEGGTATERPGTATPTEQPETETEEAEQETEGDGQETETEQEGEKEPEEQKEQEGGEEREFSEIPLDGATVDLTQVVGDKAVSVFDGELEAGTYTKIELHASGVEGIVDGEQVPVKIPSGKLQIVKPFTVEAGKSVSFVFDINVVKKGPNGYNLLPVISESGVAGKDVKVQTVGGKGGGKPGDGGGSDSEEGTETAEPDGDDRAGQGGGRSGQGGGQQGN